jgi:hypothetical protein
MILLRHNTPDIDRHSLPHRHRQEDRLPLVLAVQTVAIDAIDLAQAEQAVAPSMPTLSR